MSADVHELVDPTAQVRRRRPLAAGLSPDSDGTILLVDGMLNKAGDWGRGILDAAERVLTPHFPRARFARLDLNPLATTPADLWADATAGRCDAVVVTAGDCITCTSRGARNAIAMEARDVPAAIICTDAVEDVVTAVCEASGTDDMHRVLLHESLFGRSRDDIASIVEPALSHLPAALHRR